MSQHLILLGDSILDNAAYVPGRPAVIDQVRNRLPQGWRATLLARDGSVIDDVHRQLERLPADATHLVLSAGGNDVLFQVGILDESVTTVGEGLRRLAESRDRFEDDYRRLLHALQDLGLPAAVCTIYNPCSPDEVFQREAVAALGLFNDCIIRNARQFQLPVLDLRVVCSEIADFANPIEPSSVGGAKIAEAICRDILGHDFGRRQTVLFP
jgi:GDSL-like lipase/acylhydrolase family protein